VTIGALGRGLFIDNHRLTRDHPSLRVAFVARYVFVAPCQGEMRSRIVVERGRHPALDVVAIRTGSFPLLGKLSCVGIFVTILANLRRAFELYFLRPHRHLVTVPALDRAMRAKQREFGFRMVEVVHVCPGLNVVAGFASQRGAVCAALRLAVLELAMVRISMARSAGPVFELERKDLIRPPGRPHLMAIGARHGGVCVNQSKVRLAVLGDGESGAVKVLDRMTIFTFV